MPALDHADHHRPASARARVARRSACPHTSSPNVRTTRPWGSRISVTSRGLHPARCSRSSAETSARWRGFSRSLSRPTAEYASAGVRSREVRRDREPAGLERERERDRRLRARWVVGRERRAEAVGERLRGEPVGAELQADLAERDVAGLLERLGHRHGPRRRRCRARRRSSPGRPSVSGQVEHVRVRPEAVGRVAVLERGRGGDELEGGAREVELLRGLREQRLLRVRVQLVPGRPSSRRRCRPTARWGRTPGSSRWPARRRSRGRARRPHRGSVPIAVAAPPPADRGSIVVTTVPPSFGRPRIRSVRFEAASSGASRTGRGSSTARARCDRTRASSTR